MATSPSVRVSVVAMFACFLCIAGLLTTVGAKPARKLAGPVVPQLSPTGAFCSCPSTQSCALCTGVSKICRNGQCQVGDVGEYCIQDGDCSSGLFCVAFMCQGTQTQTCKGQGADHCPCASNSNCASGFCNTVNFQCQTLACSSQPQSYCNSVAPGTYCSPLGYCTPQSSNLPPVTNLVYTATLSGAYQVPPLATTTAGTFSVTVFANMTANFQMIIANTDSGLTMAHIHQGNSFTNGAPGVLLLPLAPNPGTNLANLPMLNPPIQISQGMVQSTFGIANLVPATYPQNAAGWNAFLADLAAGNTYVNYHTVNNPNGAARGQLTLVI